MCSGCSGEYDGGFDFDEPEDEPTDSRETSLERTARNGAARRPESAGGGRGSEVAEDYEILVTATRIIEIRTLCAADFSRADALDVDSFAVPAPGSELRQTPRGSKHYPTRAGHTKGSGNGRALAIPAQAIGEAASAQPRKLRKWLARARQAIFRLRPAAFAPRQEIQ